MHFLTLFPDRERFFVSALFRAGAELKQDADALLHKVRLRAAALWCDPSALEATELLATKRAAVLTLTHRDLAHAFASSALDQHTAQIGKGGQR